MSVTIRLRRGGRRNRPFHRIVVADSHSPRDGRFIEIIGYYDAIKEPDEFEIKRDRLLYWIKKGAKPSQSLKSLLSRRGIWKEVVNEIEGVMPKPIDEIGKSIDEIEKTIEVEDVEPQTDVATESEQGG